MEVGIRLGVKGFSWSDAYHLRDRNTAVKGMDRQLDSRQDNGKNKQLKEGF